MPPKSKRIKNITTSKENTFIAIKTIQKNVVKNAKAPRKALADKTNSASDDNDPLTSPKIRIQTRKMKAKNVNNVDVKENEKVRQKRNQKMPDICESQVLNLKSSAPISKPEPSTVLQKKPINILEPMQQVCEKVVETHITDSRPKRICRLPSKFDNHFISPSKCIPVQPIQASTPIVQNEKQIPARFDNKIIKNPNKNLQTSYTKSMSTSSSKDSSIEDRSSYNPSMEKPKRILRSTKRKLTKPVQEKQIDSNKISHTNKKQADTNNNAKNSNLKQNLCTSPCRDVNKIAKNRIIKKDQSFRLFDQKKDAKKRSANNLDVYEFTFDPAQEPPPQKKKRKRIVKKQEKPKTVYKSKYDKNVAKSLADLKNILFKKSEAKQQTKTPLQSQNKPNPTVNDNIKDVPQITNNAVTENAVQNKNDNINKNVPQNPSNTEKNGYQPNFNSFNVEAIVLNDISIANNCNDVNYSPVNSPDHVRQASEPRNICAMDVVHNDPLNIQEDISFFDDLPVASSSMNMSARNPSATPWRAEYEQLPIKWQVNTYVKANMTPAFECSFINFDNKKKHVYTNMVPEDNEPLPEIIETETVSKLKQTSIISFFKEVVERQTQKKLKSKTTPVKGPTIDNSNIEALSEEPIASNSVHKTPQKISKTITDLSDKESSTELVPQNSPMKSKTKKSHVNKMDKDVTFFGFDESEEQENVSPVKVSKGRVNALRPRSRAILQEFNVQNVPIRMPLRAKKKDRNALNKDFDQVITEQNLFQEKAKEITEETNVVEQSNVNISPEDSQSVHLFEDLEVVHSKPPRKSYGKAKKVAFQHHSESSDTQEIEVQGQGGSSGEEDNLDDLTFQMPSAHTKKLRKKKKTKQRSKKEDKEAEEWAAGFNSMCEDVDHFDLIVE